MPTGPPPPAPIVDSAREGAAKMEALPLKERVALLKAFQGKVMARREEMAQAIALETGKPLWESREEVSAVISKVGVTLSHSLPRIEDQHQDDIAPNLAGHTYHRPLGPCLVIGPFNFPCHLPNTQIISALLAGNSVVFKPSEKTAYSGQLLVECLDEASFPPGAVNLLQGSGDAAFHLVKDKAIKGIFFTGSREVGEHILHATAKDLSKLVALELGGKNAAIICRDADRELALREMISASYLTAGQRCVSVSNIFVEESLFPAFVRDFKAMARRIIVGHPLGSWPEPFMGPLIDGKAREHYLLGLEKAQALGLESLLEGGPLKLDTPGYFVGPTLFKAQSFSRENPFLTREIFGPCVTVIPFGDLDEAIRGANGTDYGLAFCLFSKNRAHYNRCLREVEAGIINYNRSTCGASAKLPFGGIKCSGNYRPASSVFIDSCVYKVASLEAKDIPGEKVATAIKGLREKAP